ncbi:MAG: hypothetical protein IKY84_10285 [Bacteroidaceae bacterium]|nr:hypothetical protein [Bacteroidaceae bacterium]
MKRTLQQSKATASSAMSAILPFGRVVRGLLLVLVAVMAPIGAWAQDVINDNRLYITVGNCDNPSQVPLTLHLTSSGIEFTAVELYIVLPDGATIQEGALGSAYHDTHSLVEGSTARGHFVSVSSENLDALPTSGEPLCTWMCDFSQLPHGIHAVDATGLFAVGVAGSEVVCYTTADHSSQFTIGDNGIANPEAANSSGTLFIYNLQGQRVSILQKGQVNIINGKKVRL